MFPSPCGVKVVGNFAQIKWDNHITVLSVTVFPSPCGVKVVGNASSATFTPNAQDLFPSPCGVKVVGNTDIPQDIASRGNIVSVPLRGKGSRKW